MTSTIHVLGSRVLILPDSKETKTASGLALPQEAQQRALTGVVVGIGPLVNISGTDALRNKRKLKIGDHIMYGRQSGSVCVHDGKDHMMMDQLEIFALI